MSRRAEDTPRGRHDDASRRAQTPVGAGRSATLGSWLVAALLLGARLPAQAVDTTRTPSGRYIYVDHHVNPSAGRLVVLTKRLTRIAELPGWLLGIVGDDVALYHRNQVHFAPTHAVELWTYDPVTRRDTRLYPARLEDIDSRLRDSVTIDRVRRTVEFRIERGTADRSASSTPSFIVVRCERVATTRQRCAERIQSR